MLYALIAIALVLTLTMFLSRNMMLGFPCGMFWALVGGQAYIMSDATWDIYYLLFFASAFGMTIFTILAAYALREKRDTIAEEELEKGEGGYIDEGKEETGHGKGDEFGPDEAEGSERTRRLRGRAQKRRTGQNRRTRL